ncbi:MAG: PKD domain-containing protein [Thermoplasmata archaeon]|nr:PKD domain-containing protein [Thermoplasmata archaeon]
MKKIIVIALSLIMALGGISAIFTIEDTVSGKELAPFMPMAGENITAYPEEIYIDTNSLTGTEQVSFWVDSALTDIEISIKNSNRSEYYDMEVWQDDDDWSNYNSFQDQLASGNTTHSLNVSSCDKLIVHIMGHADAPDLDLGIFLDGKNGEPLDGMTQENESVAFDADWDADEEAFVDDPEDGTYLIKIFGFIVNSEPAHFDMTIDQISDVDGIFNSTGTDSSPLDAYEQRSFDLTWDIPGGYDDGIYHGLILIGTAAENNLSSIPIILNLDRAAPSITGLMPGSNEIIEDPLPAIGATLSVSDGSELDRTSPIIELDGVDVTAWASVNIPYDADNGGYVAGSIIYTPNVPLANGTHSISVSVRDLAGVLAVQNWSFTVDSPYQPGISHIPEIMASINYITPIVANAESDFGLQTIELYYKNVGDSVFTMAPMVKTGTNTYNAEIPAQTELGTIEYYLKAVDANSNTATLPATNPDTAPYLIEVYSYSTPKITHQPIYLYGDDPVTIDALISDNMGIDGATLFYQIDGDIVYASVPMINEGGHLYSANIPSASLKPNDVNYYISATDGALSVTHPIDINTPHVIQYTSTDVLGGDLRIAMQSDMMTTNPLIAGDDWTWMVLERIYDAPMRANTDTDELMPYIAVGSANVSGIGGDATWGWDDLDIGAFGMTPQADWNLTSGIAEATIFYDFTGVTWHDDTQMTIHDVMFSYHVQAQLPGWVSGIKCLMDKGGEAGSNFSDTHYLHIEKVYESGDHLQAALRFELQVQYADFFKDTLAVFLLPYHIWGNTISGQAVDDIMIWSDPGYTKDHAKAWDSAAALFWDNLIPIGSNAFEFDHWDKDLIVKVNTWRDHFYKEGWTPAYDPMGMAYQPNIDSITFKVYKTSEQAVLALKNDNVDLIGWSIPPTYAPFIENEPDLAIKQSIQNGFNYLAYNMRDDKRSFGYDAGGVDIGKPFRKAVAHCIDKQTIVHSLLQDYGIAGDGPISPISIWYNNTIPKYAFDPTEAKNILANAGYRLEDGSTGATAIANAGPGNWWVNPDGSFIGNAADGVIEILTTPADYDPVRAHSCLMIVSQLQDIGINAESITMDIGSLVNRIDQRDFDMYILGWAISTEPPEYLYDFFHSANAAAGLNYPGYSNVSFDADIDLARSTGDENERFQAIGDAHASIAYDLPYDVLYYRTNIEAYRSDSFTGWMVGPSGSIFNDGSIWNIKQPSFMIEQPSTILEKHTGGELRVALQQEPGPINPLVSTDENTDNVIDLVYDPLTRIDPQTKEIMPWVAESWTIAGNKTMITVNIRENITWHDGSDLTASDVKYTYDTYALPYIDSVGVVDGLTVIMILSSPDASLFSEALQLPLFPQGFTALSQENGCGPFMLGDIVAGSHLTLETYEDYAMGRANIDSIVFTHYPDDPVTYDPWDARVAGIYRAAEDLIYGQLDYIGWNLYSNHTKMMVEVPFGSGNNTNLIQSQESSVVRNEGSGLQYIGFNTQREPMNNTEFRRAIAHIIDKESLTIFDISGGLAIADSVLNHFNYPFCNETLETYERNEALANNVLDSAGFFDRDGDGWRDLPYSPYDSFNITMFGPPIEDLTANVMAGIIVNWLKSIGINATLRSNTSVVNMADIIADDFDMYFESLEGSQDPSILYDLGHSSSALNYANFNDAGMNALLDMMKAEVDPDMRAQYAQDCEGYLASQVPYIPLFHFRVNNAYRTDGFDGWVSTLDGFDDFRSYLNVHPLMDQTPMDAPLALYAFNNSEGQVNLTWTHNIETSIIGYNIYRSNITGGPYTLQDTVGEQTSYTDNDTVNGLGYYVITAIDPVSGYSNEASCISDDLIPPTILSTTPANATENMTVVAGVFIIEFSEPMDTSIDTVDTNLPGISVSWLDADTMEINYTTLDDLTDYYVDLTGQGHRDVEANALAGALNYTFDTLDSTDPIADAGVDQAIVSGTIVAFNGSGSTDNSTIETYIWTFSDDGSMQTLTGVAPTYNFTNDGTFMVTLTVTDAYGNTHQDNMTVTVAPGIDTTPPTANAGTDQTVIQGTIVTFDGSGSTDNIGIVNYTWAFDDGTTRATITLYGESPTYNFTSPGNYIVTLQVMDDAGNTGSDSMVVLVEAAPLDTDGDGIPDVSDTDDDNDGVLDVDDDFPFDDSEATDTDGDGTGDNADLDDDDDGFLDIWEEALDTDPLNSEDRPVDTDGDGIPDGDLENSEDWMDIDDDGDDVPDAVDADPLDPEITDIIDDVSDDGGINYLWIIMILVVAILVVALLMKKKPASTPPVEDVPEETAELETELCPSCGFEIEPGMSCPFCVDETAIEPPQPEVDTTPSESIPEPHPNQAMIDRIQKAFDDGKISEDQYKANMEKFNKQ